MKQALWILAVLSLLPRAQAANYHCELPANEFGFPEFSFYDLKFSEAGDTYSVLDFQGAEVGVLQVNREAKAKYWISEDQTQTLVSGDDGKMYFVFGQAFVCEEVKQ